MILMRRGGKHSERGLEVLMLRRGSEARFMPGVWVFAGGVVEEADLAAAEEGSIEGVDAEEVAHRICGARELREEAGLEVAPTDLHPWSRWITPVQVPMRFDTRFYVGLAPAHAKPTPDGEEMSEARWVAPLEALEDFAQGTFELSFPTIKHLEELRDLTHADAVLAEAAGRPVVPLLPKVVATEDGFDVLLPGEPGFDEA